MHALSAACALCEALAQSKTYAAIVDSAETAEARQTDADTVFELLNACVLVEGLTKGQAEKCLEDFMTNCQSLVPLLLHNANLDLHACTATPAPVPLCTQAVWASDNCSTLDKTLGFPESSELQITFNEKSSERLSPVTVGVRSGHEPGADFDREITCDECEVRQHHTSLV